MFFFNTPQAPQMPRGNPAAVRGGLTLTGPTITAAGLIMAIAFGGLLLSDLAPSSQVRNRTDNRFPGCFFFFFGGGGYMLFFFFLFCRLNRVFRILGWIVVGVMFDKVFSMFDCLNKLCLPFGLLIEGYYGPLVGLFVVGFFQ